MLKPFTPISSGRRLNSEEIGVRRLHVEIYPEDL
jgi:hypothetical protein